MARQQTRKPRTRAAKARKADKVASQKVAVDAIVKHKRKANHRSQEWFTTFACETARLTGKPVTFMLAFAVVLVWGITGPMFHYSDTWQLVINTGTTIVTFLMVFLIQNTQNRDTLALQIKLAELIFVMRGAQNRLATVEDVSDEELERLHDEYRARAEETMASLTKRRGSR